MTAIEKALAKFWNQFNVPAFKVTDVPTNQPFPYLAYEVIEGDSFESTTLTTFLYARNTNEHKTLRRTISDAVRVKISYGGVLIDVDNGYIELFKNNDFMTIYNDGDDKEVIVLRISYEAFYYFE